MKLALELQTSAVVATVAPSKGVGGLPSLPLAAGAKIVGFGHSFIQNGVQAGTYSAGQTATNGHTGFFETGRSVLSWLKAMDGRFNIDIFADFANPFFAPSTLAAYTGAMQGRGGDGLSADPANPTSFPGLLNRADYVIARRPQIVYIDVLYNDISKQLKSIADIIADYDALLIKLVGAGIWCVLQTMSWSNAWPGGDGRYADVDTANAWIIAQVGREGVRVHNTLSTDGPASGIGSSSFYDGTLHPNQKLTAQRATTLLALLQDMVSTGETRSLDPLNAYNIWPVKGTPGVAGTKTNVTGDVATGMRLIRSAGTSTYVGSKEVVAAGNEKQVITITPVNDAAAFHSVTYGLPSLITLATLGLAAGDWVEIEIPVELNDWAGWDYADAQQRGPVINSQNVTVTGGSWQGGNNVPLRNTNLIVGSKLLFPPGLTMTNIRWENLLVLRHLCTTGGTGIAKIGAPIVRKLTTPPTLAWNLTA